MFFAASFAQSGHCPCCTRYSISNTCSRIVAVSTSFWIVSETRSRFECGSVQMKCASVNRTLLRPLSFFRQMARSSCDSGRASDHEVGGERKRSQFLQNETDAVWSSNQIFRTMFQEKGTLLRDALRNVNGIPKACYTEIGRVGHDGSSTISAKHSVDSWSRCKLHDPREKGERERVGRGLQLQHRL